MQRVEGGISQPDSTGRAEKISGDTTSRQAAPKSRNNADFMQGMQKIYLFFYLKRKVVLKRSYPWPKVTVKVVPAPSWLSMAICQFRASQIRLAIESPRP